MFLTHDDIATLTGKQQHNAQRRVLNAMGIIHKLRPDGSIVVLERHLHSELGGTQATVSRTKETEPNWSAL
jgi:hypothetical protein